MSNQDVVKFGDTFYLKHENGQYFVNVDRGRRNWPQLSSTGKVKLQLVGGNGEVTSGSPIKIRTTEEVTGEHNILGAFADSHDCYYWQDGYDNDKQSWRITKASGQADPIFYGDRVRISNISYSNQRLAPDTKNQGYITTVENAGDSWILEPVFVRVAQPDPVAQEPVSVRSVAQPTPAKEPVSVGSVAQPTPAQVTNQYQVQIQWGGSSAPWQEDGMWALGRYDSGKTGVINRIDITSNDGGQTLNGNFSDSVPDELSANISRCQATRSSGNYYTVVENYVEVETSANLSREFTWVLGSRADKHVVAINVESCDGGQTLNGTITYQGEEPVGFKGVRVEGTTDTNVAVADNTKTKEAIAPTPKQPTSKQSSSQPVLVFDGKDDYINCGQGGVLKALNLTQTMTLECWVNLAVYNDSMIFAQQYKPDEPDKPGQPPLDKEAIFYGLFIDNSKKIPMFIYSTKEKKNQRAEAWNTPTAAIALNQWYHLAVVVSNQQVELFINGKSQGAIKLEGAIADNADAELLIGKRYADNSHLAGQLAELRIWNKARTAAEIQANMSRRLESLEPGLVGYWLLDKGSGEIAYDSSLYDNFGIIYGATWGISELPIPLLSRKEKFCYSGKSGDIRALDAFKPLPAEVQPPGRWLTNFYQSFYGLAGATKAVLIKQILMENGGDMTKIPAKLPGKQIETAPRNLTRLRPDKYSDEFFVERRLNGFSPGQLKRVENQPWQYVIRYDFSAIQKIDAGGILPKLIEARFCLDGQELAPHSIEYTLHGETQTQSYQPVDQDWEWAKKVFRCAEFLYHETRSHLARTHLNIDQYAMAHYRNVINNPIQKLLQPHLEIVLNMNTRGVFNILGYKEDVKDIGGFIPSNSCLDIDNMYILIRQELSGLTYRNGHPRSQFLPNYIVNNHFDRAAITMWLIIAEYVGRFFANNRAGIQAHWSEIEGMSEDLSTHTILNKELGILDIKTMQDLQDLCVYVIYTSTFYHSWVNNKQYEDGGDVEYAAMSLWKEGDPMVPSRHASQLSFMQNLTSVRYNLIMDVGPVELKDAIWKRRDQIEPGLPLDKMLMSISI